MAFEYHVREARWSARKIRAFLDSWLQTAPMRFVAGEPWSRSAGGAGTWLFFEESTRGCSLFLEGGILQPRAVRVRLNLLASRADWLAAQALVRDLVRVGGGRVFAGGDDPLRPEQLRDPEAGSEALARLTRDAEEVAAQLRSGKTFAALPTPAFTLIVTAALLSDETDRGRFALALEEELIGMAARYQQAEAVPVVTLPDASSFSMWPGHDALVYLSHYVGVRLGRSEDDGVVLGGQALVTLLGDRVELVSEDHDRFYLPALDPGSPEDAALVETLRTQGQDLREWLARLAPQVQA